MKSTPFFKTILLVLLLTVAHFLPVKGQSQSAEDFSVKGFFIDLRNEVMTMDAIKDLVKELSDFGMNALFVEWEATYPYEKHAVLSNEASYTRAEIKSLIDYADQLGIAIIPMQENFGHVQYILRHDRYSDLRVKEDDISQVCACKEEKNKALFTDLLSDMASMFPSKYIFIGGDETRALGECEVCKEKVDSLGKGRVYADYMKMMADIAIGLGKTPVMWADMLLKYPKYAHLLPKETILVDWNYGWKVNHFGNVADLQKQGFTFWGAPSIRSHPDNWYLTNWITHFNNQKDFIPYARSERYQGMLMTAWSTSGVYGYTLDVGNEILDMQPIRNNYPLSGFRMLTASYAQALQQKEPIDPEDFVVQYAQDRFGLSREGGEKLWQALSARQLLLVHGKPQYHRSVKDLRLQNDSLRNLLDGLTPTKNEQEFAHFRMMADLRDFYLIFMQLKSIYNSEDFTRAEAPSLLKKVEALKVRSKEIDRQFLELNKGYLLDSELDKQAAIRNLPLEVLYKRLVAMKAAVETE